MTIVVRRWRMGSIIRYMVKTTYIYGLKDPRDDKIYYVGRTNNPQRRNWEHRASNKHAYSAWHREMHAASVKPVMIVLERVTGNGFFHEMKWMKKLKAEGQPLRNISKKPGKFSERSFGPLKSAEQIRAEQTARVQAAWRKWWDSLSAEEKSRRQRARVNEKSKQAGRDYWAKMTPEQRMQKHHERWAKMTDDAKRRVFEGYKERRR